MKVLELTWPLGEDVGPYHGVKAIIGKSNGCERFGVNSECKC